MAPHPLAHAFPPGLERFGTTLQPPRPDAVPVAELLRPASMDGIASAYGASLSSGDRRAVLSMWSQYYLLALIPAAVATATVTARAPGLALGTAEVVLSADSCPLAVCVPDLDRFAASPCPAQRLTPLLRAHLEPLVEGLAGAGLHPAVVWSNAGHVLSWALGTVRAEAGCLQALSALLREPVWIDGGANPLHTALCRGGRDVCCLRHRLPGGTRCGSCPALARCGARRPA